MNDQQVLGLIAVCAIVMIPLGMALVMFSREVQAWVSAWLPPRYLKRAGVRRRKGGGTHGRGGR